MRVRRAFPFFSALLVMGGGLALIAVPVQAVDYTWDGGGDGTSWSDPLNWDLDSSFPGPADNAIFNTGGTVNLDTAITNGFLTATVTSGRVNLNNTGNTISPGAGFTVESNATLGVSADGAASGLGGANVNLNGGTLEFMAASISTGNGLKESWFTFATNGEASNVLIDPLTATNPGSLLNLTPVAVQALDVALNFDNGTALNNRSGGTVGTDRIGALWLGNLHIGALGSGDPLEAGDVSFGTASDDGSALYIDANQDGVFDSPGEMVVNNKDTHGRRERFGSINLAEGVYGMGIGFFERTGGENMEAVYMQGVAAAYSEMSFINPSDASQLNLFTFETVPSGALSNTVTLNADSTIRMGASIPAASLDSLVVNGKRVLEVDSVDIGQKLAFTGAASLSGDLTVRLQGNARLTLPAISESVSSALSLEGDGTLALSANNDYTGLTTVQGGVLEVQANGALGEISAGTLVNSNGVLRLNGPGNLNYAEQEALELNGHGNGSVPGALSHAPGNNDDYRGPITLGSDATIYNANNVLSLFGLVDNAGHELRLVSDASNIEIESAGGITGAGDVVADGVNGRIVVFNNTKNDFDGLLTVNNIIWDTRSNDALGSTNGTTIVNNGGRLELRNGKTLADDITIFGTDNNAGAIRGINNVNTLSGTITLGSDALIWINTGQVTLTGDLTGPFQATKQGSGTLVLDGDKTLDAVVPLAGTLQVNSVGGFGQTANLFVPQGATVAFAGDLNFDGTSALQTFEVGGGRLASVSQTTTISIPLNLGLEAGITLGGAGDLVINANLGASGVVTSMPPFALNHYGFHTSDESVLNLDAGGGIWNGGNPTAHPAYFGEALLTTGPGNRGLDFNNDADFVSTGAVGQNDNYANLWIGYVNCNQTGTWAFRNAGDDDRAGIWLDLNTNGVFESIGTLPLKSNQGEQLSWEDGGNKQVTLTNGVRYLVAFTHMEFSSGSRADFRFTAPSGTERIIHPLGQAGRWSPVSGLVGLAKNELVKEDSGTVYLNGDNGYGEGSTIRGGALVPANGNALGGNDADVTILGGSLVLSGGITLDLGSVEISGTGGQGWAGAIDNLDGDNLLSATNLTAGYSQFASPAGIGSGDGQLTIDASQLDLQYSPLVFSGAGDIIFNPDIVSSAVVVPIETNILYHLGFHHSGDQNTVMDLDDNGGMMGNGNPVSFPGFFAQVQLTDGPGSRGLDFNNDADFRNAGAVGQNDYYANLWLGNVHCNQTGTWGFRNAGDDDRAGIWLDTDQDGVFESSAPGLGQNRGEQLTWENGGNKQVSLVAGQRYMIAFTHMEFGGGSRADFRFTSPGGTETIIKPSDPAQAGLWNGFEQVPDNTVSKNGSGTVTLNGSNTHTDETIINEGSLVIIAADGLGTSDAGTLIYENGTLGLSNSVTLAGESLVLEGHITSLGGSNVIALASGITVSSNATTVGLGAEAGSLTVEADIDLEYAALSVSGEGSTTLNGSLSGLGAGASRPAYADEVLNDAPLLYYQLNETTGTLVANSGTTGATDDGTVFDAAHTDLNVPSLNPTLGTAAAFDDNIATGITTPFSVNGLSNQYTIEAWVMSPGPQNNRSGIAGQNDAYEFGMRNGSEIELWNPGSGAFATPYPTGEWFHVAATGDGSTRRIYVNGVEVASHAAAVTDYGNSAFFFNIGGRGIQDAGNNAFNGFIDEVALYDKALAAADILRHYDAREAIGADNAVLKTGGGTLTLNASNTNDGQTRASGGILMVQGSTGSSNVIVSAGAVLSGSGVVGGDIQVLTRGETNPGASAGTLTGNGDLVYANYSSVFNAELESAVSADQLAIGGDIVLNNATLHLLRDAGYNPTATDVLTIATGTSVNGTFNGIAEGQRISAQGADFVVSYLGNAITLNATAGLLTYAGPDTLTRPPGEDLSVPAGDLLANDLVGDGVGPLVITGVISNALEGGSVNFDGSSVTYAPPTNGYDGVDSFTYTVSDGTDSAIGLVTVVTGEAPPSGAATGDIGGTVRLPGGDYRIAFSGTPGENYDIEWTQDLAAIPVVWQVLGTVVAAGDGSILIDHVAPPDGSNYYRAALK